MLKFRNSNQLKAFLKKEGIRLHLQPNNVYRTFVARTFLEKLSKYDNQEVLLKGSAAELVCLGKLCRAITDLDLASLNSFNDVNSTFSSVMNHYEEGEFKFDYNREIKRTPTGIYKMEIKANLDKTSQPLGIDFQENYNRLIEPTVKVMPKIFEGDEEFEVVAPSFEEYLAEKLCIVIESNKEDVLNTRVKDFYDIYQLHGGKYDNDKLTEYFGKMLKLRGKLNIDDAKTTFLNYEFAMKHQDIWNSTKEKYDFVDREIDLPGAVYYARAVLREELQKSGKEMDENPMLVKTIK